MNNKKSTKRTLLTSVLSLVLCMAMLIGTTFAWFTDNVTSSGNIIQSGSLKVAMDWAEGDENPETAAWTDASQGAIFNSTLWEPGYTEAKHIKVTNKGTLALKYQMRILANGVVSELADVIDVYYFSEAKQLGRADVETGEKLGTLSEVLNNTNEKAISKTIAGSLIAGASKTVTIALKMQESAGNEYQNLSIGTDFSIQLLATQYTEELDTFDKMYDENADFASQEVPSAMVSALSGDELDVTITGMGETTLDAGYQFEPTETAAQGAASEYANYHADFVVSSSHKVVANSLALAGYYSFYCDNFNNEEWIAMTSQEDVAAGTEIRLITPEPDNGTNGNAGVLSVSYKELCAYGNDGTGFQCGIIDLDGSNKGKTITVELRLYETYSEEECYALFGYKSTNVETGEFIPIGTFEFTFGGEYKVLDDGTVLFVEDEGDVVLYDVTDVTDAEYTVPEGVTQIGNYAFSGSSIETVEVASTVTDLGRGFDTSYVKKVILNEGLETISSRAFRRTYDLEEVVISSTVTTVADNAFQTSGIKNIVFPENVTHIGDSAFTDSEIENVIIKGDNVYIAHYAFRDCANLTSVTILSETVTLGDGMIFTNSQSNNENPNNITIYCNEKVKETIEKNGTFKGNIVVQ